MNRRSWAAFIALSIIWGMPYLLIRIAVRQLDPITLVFFRTLPSGLILLPWALKSGTLASLRGHLRWVLAYACFEFGIPWLFMGSAEKHLSSSLTALLVAIVPLTGAVLYRFTHTDERLTAKRRLGLLVGAAGVALAVGLDITGSSWSGLLEMTVAVEGYTLGPLVISSKLRDLSGVSVVASSLLMVGLCYSPWALTHLPNQWHTATIWSVILLMVFPTMTGFLLFFALIVEIGPSRATVVTYINPAIAIVLGIVILSEPLTVGLIVGFPLIIVGSLLATSQASPGVQKMEHSLPGDVESP